MHGAIETTLREQLLERRQRIERVVTEVGQADDLMRLLREVDAALQRLGTPTFRGCEVCGLDVEDHVLMMHPTIRYCLCELSPRQQAALEHDLGLAGRVQWALLPRQNLTCDHWETHYRYLPAGPVSGDYCDLVTQESEGGGLYFLVGDVSGKGVAASLVMARLSALLRTLIAQRLALPELMRRANRFLSEGALAGHYATLVCGRVEPSGDVELCNAGHCLPLVIRRAEVTALDSSALPVGVTGDAEYGPQRLHLSAGESLFVYTDGLTEASDPSGLQYGEDRLRRVLERSAGLTPARLAAACLSDLTRFQQGTARQDDLTVMIVRRAG